MKSRQIAYEAKYKMVEHFEKKLDNVCNANLFYYLSHFFIEILKGIKPIHIAYYTLPK